MPIKTKRWDDPIDADDGTRILVTRYRPRALAKEDETWKQWFPNLGPSKQLHAGAYGKTGVTNPWETYRASYLREMQSQAMEIVALAERVKNGETITLLCSSQCIRESRCHRTILRELIESRMSEVK